MTAQKELEVNATTAEPQKTVEVPQTADSSTQTDDDHEMIWENRSESKNSLEVDRDMKYLIAWLDNLSPFEVDRFIKAKSEESLEQGELLDAYFSLSHRDKEEVDSELEKESTAMESEIEPDEPEVTEQQVIPVVKTLVKSLPITRRKSEDL